MYRRVDYIEIGRCELNRCSFFKSKISLFKNFLKFYLIEV